MINVKIKLLEGATMPSYAKEGDAGVDLYPKNDIKIAPYATGVIVRTGVMMEIPKGYELQVRPKSGNSSRTPIRVVLGTVDAGYRGEIGIIIDNLSNKDALSKINPNNISLSGGVLLSNILKNKSVELNQKFDTDFWTPRKIDMVLWSIER